MLWSVSSVPIELSPFSAGRENVGSPCSWRKNREHGWFFFGGGVVRLRSGAPCFCSIQWTRNQTHGSKSQENRATQSSCVPMKRKMKWHWLLCDSAEHHVTLVLAANV